LLTLPRQSVAARPHFRLGRTQWEIRFTNEAAEIAELEQNVETYRGEKAADTKQQPSKTKIIKPTPGKSREKLRRSSCFSSSYTYIIASQ
jgi:hypothetical protein